MVVVSVLMHMLAALCVRMRALCVVIGGVIAVSLVMMLWGFAVMTTT